MFWLYLILFNKKILPGTHRAVCSACLHCLTLPSKCFRCHPSSPSTPNPLPSPSSQLSPFQKLGCSSPNSHLSWLSSDVTCFDQSSQSAKHPHSQSVRNPILFTSITEMIISSNCLVLLFVHVFIVCIGCCFTGSMKQGPWCPHSTAWDMCMVGAQ